MSGCGEYLFCRALFHQFTALHNTHLVGEAGHNRQIVRDEQVGHTELALQLSQQLQYFGTNGNVQRTGRLVADNQFRVYRQCTRNGDALQLPAGELVRIAVGVLRAQLHPL